MAAAVEKAYQAIRDGIVRGIYAAGAHLTTTDLATVTGLSRTPIREAMRRLHAEGLIEFIPNRGAFVNNLDESEIEEIYRLRVLLEGHAAGAAAVSATEAQLSELEDIAQRLDQIIIGSNPPALEQIADLNNRFHKLIVSAAGSPRLESALASIIEIPLVLRTFQRYEVAELRRSAKQHLELVSALRARDADWARSVMASHILSAQHALLRATR